MPEAKDTLHLRGSKLEIVLHDFHHFPQMFAFLYVETCDGVSVGIPLAEGGIWQPILGNHAGGLDSNLWPLGDDIEK